MAANTSSSRALGTVLVADRAQEGSSGKSEVGRDNRSTRDGSAPYGQDATLAQTVTSENTSKYASTRGQPNPGQGSKSKVHAKVAMIEATARSSVQSEAKTKPKSHTDPPPDAYQDTLGINNVGSNSSGTNNSEKSPPNDTNTQKQSILGEHSIDALTGGKIDKGSVSTSAPSVATGPNAIAIGSKPPPPIPTLPIAIAVAHGEQQTDSHAASAPARLSIEAAPELTEWQRMERDWAEACSICFDKGCDFSLPGCQDQFCRTCLDRYLTEKIRSSWGLHREALTCPVCYDELADETVRRYVNPATYALYLKNNDHRRNVGRYCPKCETRIRVSAGPPESAKERADKRTTTLALLKDTLGDAEDDYEKCLRAMTSYQSNLISATSFYEQVLHTLQRYTQSQSNALTDSAVESSVPVVAPKDRTSRDSPVYSTRCRGLPLDIHERHSCGGSPAKRARVSAVGSATGRRKDSGVADCDSDEDEEKAVDSGMSVDAEIKKCNAEIKKCNAEANPKSTKIRDLMESIVALFAISSQRLALQFLHIRHFPETACSNCDTDFCFQCGEASWHTGKTCEEAWREKLAAFATAINEKASVAMEPLIPAGSTITVAKSKPTTHSSHTMHEGHRKEANEMEALRWKLTRSKRCPTCHIFIQRDEGCNKVNCPHCGGEFCWRCLNTWTKGSCGYFSCAINGDNEMDIDDAVSLATATTKSEDKPSLRVVTSSTDAVKLGVNDSPILAKAELGVPDIATIRFGSRGHQTGDGR